MTPTPTPDTAPRIVTLRALKLGDLLVAVPALRALRRRWPEHRLALATSAWLGPLLDLTGAVDVLLPQQGMHPIHRYAQGAEVAVNLHGAGPHSNRVLDQLDPRRKLGHGAHGWDGPSWVDHLHERRRWVRMLEHHGVPGDPDDLYLARPAVRGRPGAVLVHPGAAYGSKRWPAERFVAVARGLHQAGHEVLVTGTEAERDLAGSVARRAGLPAESLLAGRTSLPELAGLVADAALLVSGDTGVAHLGYSYQTPSVVLFGPLPATLWGPPEQGPHVVLCDEEARRGEQFASSPDPALLAVGSVDVLAAARELLGEGHKPGTV